MGALSKFEWERLLRELDLPGPVKATGYALATYANVDGTKAWPGLVKLCRAAGFHHATVIPALAALEAGGLVERKSHGGSGKSAEYELTAPGTPDPAATVRTVRRAFTARPHGAVRTGRSAPGAAVRTGRSAPEDSSSPSQHTTSPSANQQFALSEPTIPIQNPDQADSDGSPRTTRTGSRGEPAATGDDDFSSLCDKLGAAGREREVIRGLGAQTGDLNDYLRQQLNRDGGESLMTYIRRVVSEADGEAREAGP
jgi:hypothetical protein